MPLVDYDSPTLDVSSYSEYGIVTSKYGEGMVGTGYNLSYAEPKTWQLQSYLYAAPGDLAGQIQVITDSLFRNWSIDQALSHAYKEQETVRGELVEKAAYYASIAPEYIENATLLVAGALWSMGPEHVATTLTYEQSLHLRAELPAGAGSVHVSVLFTPGLDPTQAPGLREEEDNTLISVFGSDGKFLVSTEGPLLQALAQFPGLLIRSSGHSRAFAA